MKIPIKTILLWTALVLFIIQFSFCGQKHLEPKIYGEWVSVPTTVTVRTEPSKMQFVFVSDTVEIKLAIIEGEPIGGFVGNARFEDGVISNNWLLPVSMTGVAHTIKCTLKGKIFENDPLETKEVQFWIGQVEKSMDVELRYTEGNAHFPMAGIQLNKID